MNDYRMPQVELGDTVYWFPGATTTLDPHVAIVTGVGGRCVNVNLLVPNSYNMGIRDGVRHCSDPGAKAPELQESGGWMHRKEFWQLRAEREAAKAKAREEADARRIAAEQKLRREAVAAK